MSVEKWNMIFVIFVGKVNDFEYLGSTKLEVKSN